MGACGSSEWAGGGEAGFGEKTTTALLGPGLTQLFISHLVSAQPTSHTSTSLAVPLPT